MIVVEVLERSKFFVLLPPLLPQHPHILLHLFAGGQAAGRQACRLQGELRWGILSVSTQMT